MAEEKEKAKTKKIDVDRLLDQLRGVTDMEAVTLLINALENLEPQHALDRENDSARWEIVQVLGETGDPRAVEPLISILRKGGDSLRTAAAKALGRIGDPRAVEPLIETLEMGIDIVRPSVATALGEIGDLRAIEPLTRFLDHGDHKVRSAVVSVLCKFGDHRAVKPLIEELVNGGNAIGKLVSLGAIAVDPLIEALRSNHHRTRSGAAAALGEIGNRKAMEELYSLLISDDSNGVRYNAARALQQLRWEPENDSEKAWYLLGLNRLEELAELGDQAIEPLLKALESDNRDFRFRTFQYEAALVLVELGDPRAVKYLIEAVEASQFLAGKDAENRVIEALVKMGEPAVAPLLDVLERNMLKDDDLVPDIDLVFTPYQGKVAIKTLGKIGDQRAVKPFLAVLEYGEPFTGEMFDGQEVKSTIRSEAAKALGTLGTQRGQRVFDHLIKVLNDSNEDEEVRAGAASGLGYLGDDRAVSPLVKALETGTTGFKCIVAIGLARLGDTRSLKPIVDAVDEEDYDWELQQEMMEVLAAIGEPIIEPLLQQLDEHGWCAWLLVGVLDKMGDPALKTLLSLLDSEDRDTVSAVIKSLKDKTVNGTVDVDVIVSRLREQELSSIARSGVLDLLLEVTLTAKQLLLLKPFLMAMIIGDADQESREKARILLQDII